MSARLFTTFVEVDDLPLQLTMQLGMTWVAWVGLVSLGVSALMVAKSGSECNHIS